MNSFSGKHGDENRDKAMSDHVQGRAWGTIKAWATSPTPSLGGKWVLSAPRNGWGNGQKCWQSVFWLCSSLNQCLLSNCFADETHVGYFKHKWFQFFCPGCIETFVRVIPSHWSCESLALGIRQMKSCIHDGKKKQKQQNPNCGVQTQCFKSRFCHA